MALTFQYLVEASSGAVEIAGSGIRAYDVLTYRREGDAPEEIAEAYALPLAAVYEALAYATEHPAEMTTLREREARDLQEIMDTVPTEVRGGPAVP